MICIQIVKKLFYKLSDFERARSALLQFYASSALQRNANNHMTKNPIVAGACSIGLAALLFFPREHCTLSFPFRIVRVCSD
jgi:hypothetical protein